VIRFRGCRGVSGSWVAGKNTRAWGKGRKKIGNGGQEFSPRLYNAMVGPYRYRELQNSDIERNQNIGAKL